MVIPKWLLTELMHAVKAEAAVRQSELERMSVVLNTREVQIHVVACWGRSALNGSGCDAPSSLCTRQVCVHPAS